MAPKKRQPKNSFYFFMKEIQQDLASKNQFKKMEEIPAIAHPKWKELSNDEKQKYEIMAKEWKEEDKRQRAVQRVDLQKLVRQDRNNPNPIEDCSYEVVPEIKKMIQYLYENDSLSDFPFIFISFNILCAPEDSMIPREIALVKYTLKDGIKDVYHAFIAPTEIPIGYAAAAKELFENVHSIPIENFDRDSKDDHLAIYRKIEAFFQPLEYGERPIVFAYDNKISRHQKCLKWLYQQVAPLIKVTPPENFVFYSATLLLMELRAIMGKPYIARTQADDCLNSQRFDYSTNTRCEYHDEVDNVHCALANAKKIGYLLSNELFEIFEIDLTSNHLPLSKDREEVFREIDIPSGKPLRMPRPRPKPELGDNSNFDDLTNIASLTLKPKPENAKQPVHSSEAVKRCISTASQPHFGVSTGVGIGRGFPFNLSLGRGTNNSLKELNQKPPIDFVSKSGNKPPAL